MKENIRYTKPAESKSLYKRHEFKSTIGDELIGNAFLEYRSRPFPHYHVLNLDVYKQKGQKHGSNLMEAVEQKLRETGRAGVLTDTIDENSPAAGMYARRGWTPIPYKGRSSLYGYNLPKGVDMGKIGDELAKRGSKRLDRVIKKMSPAQRRQIN